MKEGKGKKRKMSRRQIVRLERSLLVLAAVLLAAGGILLIRRPARRHPETKQQAQTTEQADSSPEAHQDTWTFSFAGDCTIGSLLEWQGTLDQDFQSVTGENYAYPFSGVREVFEADDFTMVNLEGTFTDSEDAVVKPYRFRGKPAYARILKEGGVDAVSMANNHSGDFKEEGKRDTVAALDAAGILHSDAASPLIFALQDGFTVGIISYNTVDTYTGEWQWRQDIKTDIDTCKSAGCSLIFGFMHWGTVEYLPEPEAWEVSLAHDMADWGCDLIVGGHAHILQRMEYYNEVPIFYSMGNFCYGGNTNPDDKDSVIVQAEYTWDAGRRRARRESLRVIPCLISSRKDRNDYCPTLCDAGSGDLRRILEKLEWSG